MKDTRTQTCSSRKPHSPLNQQCRCDMLQEPTSKLAEAMALTAQTIPATFSVEAQHCWWFTIPALSGCMEVLSTFTALDPQQ